MNFFLCLKFNLKLDRILEITSNQSQFLHKCKHVTGIQVNNGKEFLAISENECMQCTQSLWEGTYYLQKLINLNRNFVVEVWLVRIVKQISEIVIERHVQFDCNSYGLKRCFYCNLIDSEVLYINSWTIIQQRVWKMKVRTKNVTFTSYHRLMLF